MSDSDFQFSKSEPEPLSPAPSKDLDNGHELQTSSGSDIDSDLEGGRQRLSTAEFMAEAFKSKTAKSRVGIKRKRDHSVSRERTECRLSNSKFENV